MIFFTQHDIGRDEVLVKSLNKTMSDVAHEGEIYFATQAEAEVEATKLNNAWGCRSTISKNPERMDINWR